MILFPSQGQCPEGHQTQWLFLIWGSDAMLGGPDPTWPRSGHPGTPRCCQDGLCSFKMGMEQLRVHLAHVNTTQTLGQCLHLNIVEFKHSSGVEQVPRCSAGVPRSHLHGAWEPGCCCKTRSLGLGTPTENPAEEKQPIGTAGSCCSSRSAHRREGRSCDHGIKVNLLCDMDLDYRLVTARLDGLNVTPVGREGREREMLQKAWPRI